MAGPELINPMVRMMPIHGDAHPGQREQVKLLIASPSSEIIGEGAAIFTDMTETILDVLDKQVATSPGSQQHAKGLSSNDDQKEMIKSKEPRVSTQKEDYPDLFLPIMENYKISDHFCGYLDSLSADNNPMVLVELNNLSYRYGTSIYAVDRVNGTMYSKFSVGYRMIPEKAMIIPQYQHTSVEDEYAPTYENTLPGITSIATPIAKSTPVTQASHIPVTKTIPEGDIVQPMSSEKARAAYLESQTQGMDSVWLPLNTPLLEDGSHVSSDLARRISIFCKEQKERRKQEQESHRQALYAMKQCKGKQPKQPDQEEREVVYSQIAQNMEKTRDVV